MKAFVDSREPKEIKLKTAKGNANGDITFNTRELSQGDFYLPKHDVVVERKEASDFASSTTDGRLSEQADRMVAEHDHVFVIVEGSPYNLQYSNIQANSVTGMQTSLAVKRGIKIIYTESMNDTVYAVNRVFERFADEEHEQAGDGYVKTADTGVVEDVQVAMLAQIDGISIGKAENISSVYNGSLSELALDCSHRGRNKPAYEALTSVDGVGEVLANRVIEAFQ